VVLSRMLTRRTVGVAALVAFAAACGETADQPLAPTPGGNETANSAHPMDLILTPGSLTFVQADPEGALPAPKKIVAFNQAAMIPSTGIVIGPVQYQGGASGWLNVNAVIKGLSADINAAITPNTLPQGGYTATFTVRVPGTRNATNPPLTVTVSYIKGIYYEDNAEQAGRAELGGLWNRSQMGPSICNVVRPSECLPNPAEGQWAYWYGSPATGNFNFGDNQGDLVTQQFTVPSGAIAPEVRFQSSKNGECGSSYTCGFDDVDVYFRDANGGGEILLARLGSPLMPDYDVLAVSLEAAIGRTGRLVFRFDTGDALFNDFRGWIIDNIIAAEPGAFLGGPLEDVDTFYASGGDYNSFGLREAIVTQGHPDRYKK
jgi:hypothetical protein